MYYCKYCLIIVSNPSFTSISRRAIFPQKQLLETIVIGNYRLLCLFRPVICTRHHADINQPSITLNRVNNISVKMCLCAGGCNILDVLICLFQFISRPHPATLTPKSIPSFMVHHLQSILPLFLLQDGLPPTGHMYAELQTFSPPQSCWLCSGR